MRPVKAVELRFTGLVQAIASFTGISGGTCTGSGDRDSQFSWRIRKSAMGEFCFHRLKSFCQRKEVFNGGGLRKTLTMDKTLARLAAKSTFLFILDAPSFCEGAASF